MFKIELIIPICKSRGIIAASLIALVLMKYTSRSISRVVEEVDKSGMTTDVEDFRGMPPQEDTSSLLLGGSHRDH